MTCTLYKDHLRGFKLHKKKMYAYMALLESVLFYQWLFLHNRCMIIWPTTVHVLYITIAELDNNNVW